MYPRGVPYENSPPPRDNIVTVGMPGVTSTRSQMSRYTGGDFVTVLCNWGDDPQGPMHKLQKHANRYSSMPMGQRVRRAIRIWGQVVIHGQQREEDDAPRTAHGANAGGAIAVPGASDVVLEVHESDPKAERQQRATGGAVAPVNMVPLPAPAQTPSLLSSSARMSLKRTDEMEEGEPVSESRLPTLLLSTTSSARTALETPLADPKLQDANNGRIDPPVLYCATCRVAPRLLHGVLPSPEVAESRHRRWYWTLNPIHWFLTAKEIITGWWFCVRPIQLCYSEPGRSNMGGLRDQAAYTREVKRAIYKIETDFQQRREEQSKNKEQKDKDNGGDEGNPAQQPPPMPLPKKKHLVLFGVSRGATTCFYAAMKLRPEEAEHVSLVLVEAPFDTLEHVIDASSRTPRLLRWFFRSFCDWRGYTEEKEAYGFDPQNVHLRCPVAFVMSVKDRRVPNTCTQALIDRVKRELVPHVIPAVEVLVLQHSRHPCMAVGNKEDQDAYVAFVEGLYNKYCP